MEQVTNQFGQYTFKPEGGHFVMHHDYDRPAFVSRSGHKVWYVNGKRHRDNGPAVMYVDGRKKWFKDGVLHNERGPAATWADGAVVYAVNGKIHRTDGPAIISRFGVCVIGSLKVRGCQKNNLIC